MAWPPVVAIVGPDSRRASPRWPSSWRSVLGGEIVNADAFQVYRGMDIGTAKVAPGRPPGDRPPPARHPGRDRGAQRRAVPARRAARSCADLARRGVPAVVVGGSGLYVRALLDDLRFPGSDPEIRARWEAMLAEIGPERCTRSSPSGTRRPRAHILPTQRAAHRAGPRGRRAHRASRSPRSCPPTGRRSCRISASGWTSRATSSTSASGRGCAGCSTTGLVEEVRGLLGRGPARRAHRQPGTGLPAGDRPPRRPARPARGRGGHRAGDPPLRPPPAALVPPRSADDLAGRDGPAVVHSFADRGPAGRACP